MQPNQQSERKAMVFVMRKMFEQINIDRIQLFVVSEFQKVTACLGEVESEEGFGEEFEVESKIGRFRKEERACGKEIYRSMHRKLKELLVPEGTTPGVCYEDLYRLIDCYNDYLKLVKEEPENDNVYGPVQIFAFNLGIYYEKHPVDHDADVRDVLRCLKMYQGDKLVKIMLKAA